MRRNHFSTTDDSRGPQPCSLFPPQGRLTCKSFLPWTVVRRVFCGRHPCGQKAKGLRSARPLGLWREEAGSQQCLQRPATCPRFRELARCDRDQSLEMGIAIQTAVENVDEKYEERLPGVGVPGVQPTFQGSPRLSPSAIVRETVSWAEDQGKGLPRGKSGWVPETGG